MNSKRSGLTIEINQMEIVMKAIAYLILVSPAFIFLFEILELLKYIPK